MRSGLFFFFFFFFFFVCFWWTSGSFFIMFSSVAPHRGQPAAMCHPRWKPTRKLADSCGLGRRRIRTQDCRTSVWRATIELPRIFLLPLNFKWVFDVLKQPTLKVHQFSFFYRLRFSVRTNRLPIFTCYFFNLYSSFSDQHEAVLHRPHLCFLFFLSYSCKVFCPVSNVEGEAVGVIGWRLVPHCPPSNVNRIKRADVDMLK